MCFWWYPPTLTSDGSQSRKLALQLFAHNKMGQTLLVCTLTSDLSALENRKICCAVLHVGIYLHGILFHSPGIRFDFLEHAKRCNDTNFTKVGRAKPQARGRHRLIASNDICMMWCIPRISFLSGLSCTPCG